ncbi:MAG TPA: DUF3892 domain-containing protein [Steroidobacteraceae bacterium]|nr:DUF3892 domain-containing protein [Steroidobacteraceae bacterium]
MNSYHVNCINKPNRESRHEHITHIGFAGKWRMTRERAIREIDAKESEFYTVDKTTGKRAYVGVVRESGKAPFLRTYADKTWNDNLLAQQECGGDCQFVG